MYKSLKISLHLTQNCIFTNWLQKKKIDKFKEFIFNKQNFKIFVVGSGNFRANFHFYYWRPKSYQKNNRTKFSS